MIPRYRDRDMTEIWGDVNRLNWWFRIEVANMRRAAGSGAADMLEMVGCPDPDHVNRVERRVRHDVMAFLYALDERIQAHTEALGSGKVAVLRQWLHYGLTSSDVVDTALAKQVQKAHGVLMRRTREVDNGMQIWLGKLENQTRIARTHGQLAHPIPAGHHWSVLWGMLQNARRQFGWQAVPGKMSGPVGINEAGEAEAMNWLQADLGQRATQIVPRDHLAAWARAVVGMTDVCEAIATQAWLLAQEGIAEVREGRAREQIGSSAMPHKRNPVMSEGIRGLCRLARSNAQVLQAGVTQWGEHDLAHSSVERVALPDLCHLAATILGRTAVLLLNLEQVQGWSEDLTQYGTYPVGATFTDTHAALMQLQESGTPYVEAHAHLATYQGGTLPQTIDATREDTNA